MIDLVILTGVNGAGKSLAVQTFEEAGFFITDNIPVSVINNYFDAIIKEQDKYSKVALTVPLINAHNTLIEAKKHKEFDIKFVGLTASWDVLNERFRLSRKLHPNQAKGLSLLQCVEEDLALVKTLRDEFDVFIDTSKLSVNEYRSLIYDTCIDLKQKFTVSFYSFGYKISVPQDIETVFDVRLLPNPFWVPELKGLTGLDEPVKKFVLEAPQTKEYLLNVINYLDYYLAELKKNDRNHASIGIACSGGQHRSVAIAEYLAEYYSKDYSVSVTHKDLVKK